MTYFTHKKLFGISSIVTKNELDFFTIQLRKLCNVIFLSSMHYVARHRLVDKKVFQQKALEQALFLVVLAALSVTKISGNLEFLGILLEF